MYRASRLSSAIRAKSTYSAYNRNKIVPGAENPYDCNPRCSLCGTNMDYKNIQLISQFISPFSGKLVTRERSNLCIKKYKELQNAHKIAKKLLLIGQTKEPIFTMDRAADTQLVDLPASFSHRRMATLQGGLTSRNSLLRDEVIRIIKENRIPDELKAESEMDSKSKMTVEAVQAVTEDRWIDDELQALPEDDNDLTDEELLALDDMSMVERREFFEPEPDEYRLDDEKLLTFDDYKDNIDKKYEMNKEVAFDYIQDLEMQMKSEDEIIDTPLKMEELALEEASGRSAVDKKETKKTKKTIISRKTKAEKEKG